MFKRKMHLKLQGLGAPKPCRPLKFDSVGQLSLPANDNAQVIIRDHNTRLHSALPNCLDHQEPLYQT